MENWSHPVGKPLTLINEILDFSAVEKGELTFESIEFNPRKVAKEFSGLEGGYFSSK